MALRHAVLTALLAGESTGYDLSKRFDASVANFWPASQQQIYRELDRLHREELLEVTVVEQEKRPNKRVFRLNERGRGELAGFIREETKPATVRDDLLVKVAALNDDNGTEIAAAIRRRRSSAEEKLVLYEHLQAAALDGSTETEFLERGHGAGLYLALKRGLSFERENLRWYDEVLAVVAPGATSADQ